MQANDVHAATPGVEAVRRRHLLRAGFGTGMGVLTAGGLGTLADFLNPRNIEVKGFGSIITVPNRQVPKPGGQPFHHVEGRFWLVNLKPGEGVPEQFQAIARPSKKGGLLALYHKCTHLGCALPWREDYQFQGVAGWFRCPCHTMIYSKGGVRVFGMVPRSMDTFRIVNVSDRGVAVNTGYIHLGGLDDPQRTVPAGPFA